MIEGWSNGYYRSIFLFEHFQRQIVKEKLWNNVQLELNQHSEYSCQGSSKSADSGFFQVLRHLHFEPLSSSVSWE